MMVAGDDEPRTNNQEGIMKRYVMIAALAAAIGAFTAGDRAGAMTMATPAGMQSAVNEMTPIEQVRWWHGGHRHWRHPVFYHPYYYRACGYWTPWGYRPCYRPWGFYRPWGWRSYW
jgi:hypothetical protein